MGPALALAPALARALASDAAAVATDALTVATLALTGGRCHRQRYGDGGGGGGARSAPRALATSL